MIPKIAHIHWAGNREMNWLRQQSIISFMRHNPSWEVRVVPTPPEIRAYDLMWGQEADWTWWRTLARDGGWLIASDLISVRPIPDEWQEFDMCAQVDRGVVAQFGALGVKPGHPFMRAMDAYCEGEADKYRGSEQLAARNPNYEVFGIEGLATQAHVGYGKLHVLQRNNFCPLGFSRNDFDLIWGGERLHFPKSVYGVHWYGGGDVSKIKEWETGPDGGSAIERLALKGLDAFQ